MKMNTSRLCRSCVRGAGTRVTHTSTTHNATYRCRLYSTSSTRNYSLSTSICASPKCYKRSMACIDSERIMLRNVGHINDSFNHVHVYTHGCRYSTAHQQDTIFSLSSGHGKCGVAVIRASGPGVVHILNEIAGFEKPPLQRKAILRRLVDPRTKEAIDKGLVLWFPGPASFTGEDCVELQVHGGPAVVAAVLAALYKLPSCRQADAGEFTKRAFMNGKLDLTEVEGLGDLIHAETEAQRRQALRQMDGGLRALYTRWRTRIIKCVANIEAYIDFSEDQNIESDVVDSDEGVRSLMWEETEYPEETHLSDLATTIPPHILPQHHSHTSPCPLTVRSSVAGLECEIRDHLHDNRQGERLREGVHVAIIGEPNVGKSSLLNTICQRPAAIVTPIPGTTRDIIESSVNIGGFPVLLSDTAGLRHTDDEIEKEGVKRALNRAQTSDINVLLVDVGACDDIHTASADLNTFIKTQLTGLGILLNASTNNNHGISDLTNLTDEKSIAENNDRTLLSEENTMFEDHQNGINFAAESPENLLLVFNKSDLLPEDTLRSIKDTCMKNEIQTCFISCLNGDGIGEFLATLRDKVELMCGNPLTGHPSLTQVRHRSHLMDCLRNLAGFTHMMDIDDHVLAAHELRKALRDIGSITGQITSEDILNVIFKDFCIGK